jgi:hypothetical protein
MGGKTRIHTLCGRASWKTATWKIEKKWEDNIKTDFTEMGFEVGRFIEWLRVVSSGVN